MRKGLVTTNDQKPTGQGEPQKLNVITSAIIPNAVPQPEPKGTDLSRMITTHDIGDEVILREVPKDSVEVEVGKAIDLALAESEPKKKAGRPKKA